MNFKILSPNKEYRTIEMSPALEKHWAEPINSCDIILQQINNGTYAKWFEGKIGMTVIDFGANVGLTALYFLPACKKMVLVEPTPSHNKLLYELFMPEWEKSNSDQIFPFQLALAEKEMDVVFCTGHATENKITSDGGYGNNKITVQAKPLSYFIDKAGGLVDFCKVDIESGEMKALTVEQLKYAYGKVKTFFVEVHPGFGGGMDENREELKVRFLQAGYAVEQIDYQTIVATN